MFFHTVNFIYIMTVDDLKFFLLVNHLCTFIECFILSKNVNICSTVLHISRIGNIVVPHQICLGTNEDTDITY